MFPYPSLARCRAGYSLDAIRRSFRAQPLKQPGQREPEAQKQPQPQNSRESRLELSGDSSDGTGANQLVVCCLGFRWLWLVHGHNGGLERDTIRRPHFASEDTMHCFALR